MKKISLLLTLALTLSISALKAQNSPFFIWGTDLDGSTMQKGAIYANAQNGFLFESPLNGYGTKLPIEFNWRGGGTPALRILANGNIAIGTDDPRGNKLAVAGSIIAESVTVKMHGSWPDYVFSKNYQLPSLKDLKYYISENKHLPNFPSAADIEKSGINLGEMNKALTQKVEELTLYLIEKDQNEKEQTLLNQKINAQLDLQNKINLDLQNQLAAILKKLKSSSHPKKVN